jgi:integrase
MAIDRLIARREVHLREKTFYRMLYETTARAEEILGLNIEDLDLAGRRAPVKAKGARAKTRRRGQTREDFVLETVYVFVTHRRPGPGRRSPRGTSARIPGSPACPAVRPAPCWTSTPRCAGPVPAGICTSTATPP